ncbi:NAD-dependent epimerase/dehydratase family protein [Paenisporosarcina cavernae]|uniref:NAD-dependent epimerase/dehydratase family protein n=1 Tax=Paenisporosarcina cavernae TaxID=2320858 RepID=A0A385YSD8_9BACL|nr:NAD-dependent epimerase/dehydratase family protein [Paenisporosarcina cavernae]AYC28907.1 NAD-dependent epimerase/dehydratase family protein [Paenisporosarcina cavernae]
MKRALVMGGTRFFGVRLVEGLLEKGYDVTIATRGVTSDSFGDRVNRLVIDRDDLHASKESLQQPWDVVFDNICYASKDAMEAVEIFEGYVKKYVVTSSKSVYSSKENIGDYTEEHFEPVGYEIVINDKSAFAYDEGKRQVEAVFFQRASFPVVAVRFPIVLGDNDYTKRLDFYIEHILTDQPFKLDHPEAAMDFISEEEAGRFLVWAGECDFVGPVNADANGHVEMGELVRMIEEVTEKSAVIEEEGENSPYNLEKTWLISNKLAESAGFQFTQLVDWLPGLIERRVNELS